MLHWLCHWWSLRRRQVTEEAMLAPAPDHVDVLNNDYAELVDGMFCTPSSTEPVLYTEETHTRIQHLRSSISEELERRSSAEPEEKRRSWRFMSIDSQYKLSLFHGYIDDTVKVEPKLLRDTSIVRLLSLDIIG
jgi:hypothetical protein